MTEEESIARIESRVKVYCTGKYCELRYRGVFVYPEQKKDVLSLPCLVCDSKMRDSLTVLNNEGENYDF